MRKQTDGWLPDFIIGGAMKAGTSQLHTLLRTHEKVYIPKFRESQFFCLDDFNENQNLLGNGSNWTFRDYESDFRTYFAWYKQFFEQAESHQLIGEDATHYLSSEKAPRRIAEMLPDVKLIFSLRDPVERTYSHYWHDLAAGRATYRFEKELRFKPQKLVKRSLYKQHIERYLEHFPRQQIKFVVFEDYIHNTQRCVDELWAFLNLPKGPDISKAALNRNASWYPRFPSVLAWQNTLFQSANLTKYQTHFRPPGAKPVFGLKQRIMKRIDHRLRYLNLRKANRPPMDPGTRAFLQQFYAKENRGLSELIGVDLSAYWTCT